VASTLAEKLAVPPRHDDPRPLVLYHGRGCPDGFAAALAAWLFYGAHCELRALDHGEICSADGLGDLGGRFVYLLDFAFSPELLAHVAARAARLVVLDHHQSACDQLRGWRGPTHSVVHFDMEKSGARLAWEFFHPEKPVPALIRCVEDRDLWRWQFADSAAFLAALDMLPRTLARWAEIAAFTPQEEAQFAARGAAMDEKFQQLCRDMAQNAQPVVFNGIPGLMLNCPSIFHSQVGDLLARKSGSFALLWHASSENPGREVKVGLRSRSSFDCIPLAASFGGGGHAQASGFKMDKQYLAQLLAGELQAGPSLPL